MHTMAFSKGKDNKVTPTTKVKSKAKKTSARSNSRCCSCESMIRMIDDGFFDPDVEVIKQRLEVIVLLAALVISMLAAMLVSVGVEDFDGLSLARRNHTIRELAKMTDCTPNFFFMPESVCNQAKYALKHKENSAAWFAEDNDNIFYSAKQTYEIRTANGMSAICACFYTITLCFFTFNHARNEHIALVTWYRWNAILIAVALCGLIVAFAQMFHAFPALILYKGWNFHSYLWFHLTFTFFYRGLGFLPPLITLFGLTLGNCRAHRELARQAEVEEEDDLETGTSNGIRRSVIDL